MGLLFSCSLFSLVYVVQTRERVEEETEESL